MERYIFTRILLFWSVYETVFTTPLLYVHIPNNYEISKIYFKIINTIPDYIFSNVLLLFFNLKIEIVTISVDFSVNSYFL